MRVIATRGYARRADKLLTSEGRTKTEAEIVARPDAWPVIPGTGGARKARVALPGRGKSGGARVIYFFAIAPGLVAFLDIYAKNTKETLSDADKKAIRHAIGEIEQAARAHGAG
jgi:hypothetical protein